MRALEKERELEEKIDADGMVAHMGGAIGVNLGDLALDDPLDAQSTEGVQGILNWLRESAGGGNPTVRDVLHLMSRRTRVTGTPERSALLDKVAELVQLGRRSGVTRAELTRLIETAP